jgi:hypothetical protein
MTGFKVPTCQTCGHALGDHRSSGSGALFARSYGVCLIRSCECREFVEVTIGEEGERDAA